MPQSLLITPVGGSIITIATTLITILAGWLILGLLHQKTRREKATPRVQ
ncbi:hypothetical protein HY483_02470 [Candidatus Woesearchaeota archaeon]|nr:hypothetical protein [Candidatus Woesearchaeota archaeon]